MADPVTVASSSVHRVEVQGPPPLTPWECDRITFYIDQSLIVLASPQYLEEGILLGDFCAELRDMDCESRWIDEVIMNLMHTGRGEMQRIDGETVFRIHPLYRAWIAKDRAEEEKQKNHKDQNHQPR